MNAQNSTGAMVRLGSAQATVGQQFGPLTDLIGTWVGSKGWNLVAVPNQDNGFTLLAVPYTETLVITPLSTPTPNRGTHIIQEVPTLMYSLQINSLIDGSLMHAENGTWLLLPDCPSDFSIARQASVPHGDSLLALGGSSVTAGAPTIPDIDALPITGGGEPLGYTDPYLTPSDPPGFNKTNPNATLQEAIAGQTISSTTTLVVNTANQGGITNIPFITQNANTTSFEGTFWIETVDNGAGGSFLQLQYSQTTIIEFLQQPLHPDLLVQWPHVNINTLVKQ